MIFKIGNRVLEFQEDTKYLVFDGKAIAPDIRTYAQMKHLYEYKDANMADSEGLYFMYRGIYFSDTDKHTFESNNLRYDITIISPQKIGSENNKTFWHFHPKNHVGKYYEEIYEVLSWKAIYFQQNNEKYFFSPAEKWEKVIMKSWFWHITINASEYEYLVMVNIVSSEFSSEYWVYKEKKGWGYYLKNMLWQKNELYTDVLPIEEINENKLWENIYDDFIKNPDNYNFLK
jgi:glucose-6-phosphate isomerase, archaeal